MEKRPELTHCGKLTDEMNRNAKAKIEDYPQANTFDRVVLIIDDLDRCPPDKVYDVLQAVHLFLSFPLFAAMVGVDTRWMETSLRKQLGELVSGENGATPRDYREKIFQIPYWSKALQPDQAQSFVSSLLSDINAQVENPPPSQPVGNRIETTEPTQAGSDPVSNPTGAAPALDEPTPTPPLERPEPDPISTFAGPTDDEAAYLTEGSGLAKTSPRRVIRFLNICF